VGSIWDLSCEKSGASSYKWRARLVGRQPRIYVQKNANQTSLVSNTPTKIIFQTLTENNNGDFELTTADRFDCIIPGRYRFSGCLWTAPDAANQLKHIVLYKDGAQFKGNLVVSVSTNMFSIWGDWSDDVIYGKYYELYTKIVHGGGGGTIRQNDPESLGHTYFIIEREAD